MSKLWEPKQESTVVERELAKKSLTEFKGLKPQDISSIDWGKLIRYDEEQIFEALLGLISVGNSEFRPTKQDIAESNQISAHPDESVYLFQPKNESKKLLVFDILKKELNSIELGFTIPQL